MPDKFQGFDLPEQNWFKMPNEWVDITADMSSIAELKVVEYILRHTWGYQEYGIKKRITTDEFMFGRKREDGTRIDKGTGLSKQSVITGLKLAVTRGLLEEEVDDKDKARIKKYYSLRLKRDAKGENKTGVKNLDPDVKNLDISGQEVRHRTEKETIERNLKKKNKDNNSGVLKVDSNVVVALGKKGLGKNMAQEMASRHSEPYIFERIDFLEYLQDTDPDKVKKPSGWLRRAIEEGYGPPDGYSKDWRDRKKAEETAQKERKAAQESLMSSKVDEDAKRRELNQAQLERLRSHYGTNEGIQNEWAKVVDRLTISNSNQAEAKMFLSGTELLSLTDSKAVIWATTKLQRERIENIFSTDIKRLLAKALGVSRSDVELQFIMPEVETPG